MRALPAGHEVTMLISDERQLSMLPDLPWAIGLRADERARAAGSPCRSTS